MLSDQRNCIFQVKIAKTESVGSLKEAIKEKKYPTFQHIGACALYLWKVSEVIDQNLKNNLQKANFPERDSLSPVNKLSKVFPNLPVKGHLHIMVGQLIAAPDLSLQGKQLALCRRKKDKVPSSEGYFETFRDEQGKKGHEIHCGHLIHLIELSQHRFSTKHFPSFNMIWCIAYLNLKTFIASEGCTRN